MKTANDSLTNAKDGDISEEMAEIFKITRLLDGGPVVKKYNKYGCGIATFDCAFMVQELNLYCTLSLYFKCIQYFKTC